jgi:hypothetical protein
MTGFDFGREQRSLSSSEFHSGTGAHSRGYRVLVCPFFISPVLPLLLKRPERRAEHFQPVAGLNINAGLPPLIPTLRLVTRHSFINIPHPLTVRIATLYTHVWTWKSSMLQSNPVVTTSVYTTPRLYRQTFCGTNSFLTANHNITLLGYNDTRL